MAGPTLKLLVLKTGQVDRLRVFYAALGVELADERHCVNGPANVPSLPDRNRVRGKAPMFGEGP